jgi:parallel beta-helix repeat protein
MKKTYVVVVVLLFFTVGCVEARTHIESRPLDGSTLYVGGVGPGNYSSIQDAIDHAVDGDTVFVCDDSSPYHQKFDVNKSISVIGENNKTTIIDATHTHFGDGYVIHVHAHYVNLSGFTIMNSDFGIRTEQNGNYSDNIFSNVEFPFYVQDSSNNTIHNNRFSNVKKVNGHFLGITMYQAYNNTITDNFIDDDRKGSDDAGIFISFSKRNTIMNNIMLNCSLEAFEGTYADNTFIGNTCNGKHIVCLKDVTGITITDAAAVSLVFCSGIKITNLSFSNQWIAVSMYESVNSLVSNCSFSACHGSIRIVDCTNITASGNTIRNSHSLHPIEDYSIGITLSQATACVLKDNAITNSNVGIELQESDGNMISHNLLRGNRAFIPTFITEPGGGIYVDTSNQNTITDNSFILNQPNAFYTFSENTWHHNYWGRPRILPKPIFGLTYGGPWYPPQLTLQLDKRPALAPQ